MILTDEEKLEQARKQKLIDYRITFGSESGARVLKDLEDFCGLYHPCFADGHPDLTAFMLGSRNVALRIKKFLDMDPEQKKQEKTYTEEET